MAKISIDKIRTLADRGLAQSEIAYKLGCCRQYISQVVHAYGIKIKKDLRLVKRPRVVRCVMCGCKFIPEMYETSCSEKCRKLRYSPKFCNIVRRFSPSDVRKIRRLREKGVPVREMAELFGCELATIYNIIRGKTYSHVK